MKNLIILLIMSFSLPSLAALDVTCIDDDCLAEGWVIYDYNSAWSSQVLCTDFDCDEMGWVEDIKWGQDVESIGFRITHLKQIFNSGKVNLETVSQSIEALSHDIRHNKIPPYVKSPLLLLMKLLRSKGEAYNSFDDNFETDEDRMLREQLETLKSRRAKMEQMKKSLFEEKFYEWREALSLEEKKKLKPPMLSSLDGPIFDAALRNYFEKNVYGEGL